MTGWFGSKGLDRTGIDSAKGCLELGWNIGMKIYKKKRGPNYFLKKNQKAGF